MTDTALDPSSYPWGKGYEVETRYGTAEVRSDTALTDTQIRDRLQAHFDGMATASQQQPTTWQDIVAGAQAVRPTALNVAGMTLGAARGAPAGAALGAAGGPLGMAAGGLAGGIGGAALGGMLGASANNILDRPTPQQGLTNIWTGARQGAESQVLGGMLGAGAGAALGRGGRAYYGAQGLGIPSAALGGAPALTGAVRGGLVDKAKSMGVSLSAAEQTGNPLFNFAEQIAGRSATGQSAMQPFAEQQAGQMIGTGQRVAQDITGPPMDVMARNNRFVKMIQGSLADAKDEGNRLYGEAYSAIGLTTPTNADHTIAVAQALKAELPTVRGEPVKGFGLGQLDDLVSKILPADTMSGVQQAFLKQYPGSTVQSGITQLQGPAMQPAQGLTIGELRKLQTALGPMAFPDKFAGAATVDSAVARNARRLWGAIGDDIQATAGSNPQAKALLENAKQYWKVQVQGFDAPFYADLLASEKNLSGLTSRLFNRNDPGILLDAKKVVTPDGWKLIQQQYWDDIFNASLTNREGGIMGFDGKKFADRILNSKEQRLQNVLFDPEAASAIRDFAKVSQLTSRTSLPRDNQLMGFLVTMGQTSVASHGVYRAMTGGSAEAAASGLGEAAISMLGPYMMGKIMTNPTSARILANAYKTGTLTPETAAALTRYMVRFRVATPSQSEQP